MLPWDMSDASNPTAAQTAFMAWFRECLRNNILSIQETRKAIRGIDLNFVDDAGQSPLTLICERAAQRYTDKEIGIIKVLMKAGANPMLHGTFASFARHRTLAGLITHNLAKTEADDPQQGLRSEAWENPLHLVAPHHPRIVHDLLEREPSRSVALRWLGEARLVDQATPAHMVWRKLLEGPTSWTKQAPSAYADPGVAALVASEGMLDAGVDLSVVDAFGQSASQMAIQCVDLKRIRVIAGWRPTINRLRKIAKTTPVEQAPAQPRRLRL